MNYLRWILSILTIAPLLVLSKPAFSQNLEISGNGADSQNSVTVNNNSNTNLIQGGNAQITNDVNTQANTGGNQANGNTGGGASINTGNSQTNTTINNNANFSGASTNCCQDPSPTSSTGSPTVTSPLGGQPTPTPTTSSNPTATPTSSSSSVSQSSGSSANPIPTPGALVLGASAVQVLPATGSWTFILGLLAFSIFAAGIYLSFFFQPKKSLFFR